MAYAGNTNMLGSFSDPMVKEDMAPVLSIATPVELPFQYLFSRETVNRRDPQWGVDFITTPTTISDLLAKARVEGRDAAFDGNIDLGFRLLNLCEISSRDVDITNTERATLQYGYDDAFDQQMWKKGKEVGIEFEIAMRWGAMTQSNVVQTGTGRQMHGLVRWAAELGIARAKGNPTHQLNGSPASPAIPSQYFSTWKRTTTVPSNSDTDAELTRAVLYDDILTPAWRNGFVVAGSEFFMSTSLKRQIAFLNRTANGPINNREIPADRRMIVDTVSMVETDLGTVYFNIDRYMDLVGQNITLPTSLNETNPHILTANKCLLGLQRDYVSIGVLRGIYGKPLPELGDSSKGMVVGETTIIVKNPIALCGGSNLIPNASA